jgi:DNA polymerase IIIc chi subunit
MKDKKVEERVMGLIEKAQATGKPVKIKASSARRRSSLHQIIKTKDQADALMAALKTL